MQLRPRATSNYIALAVFGPSRRLQRAAQVSVSLHALLCGRGRAPAKGMGVYAYDQQNLHYRKNGSAANSTSPPKSYASATRRSNLPHNIQ